MSHNLLSPKFFRIQGYTIRHSAVIFIRNFENECCRLLQQKPKLGKQHARKARFTNYSYIPKYLKLSTCSIVSFRIRTFTFFIFLSSTMVFVFKTDFIGQVIVYLPGLRLSQRWRTQNRNSIAKCKNLHHNVMKFVGVSSLDCSRSCDVNENGINFVLETFKESKDLVQANSRGKSFNSISNANTWTFTMRHCKEVSFSTNSIIVFIYERRDFILTNVLAVNLETCEQLIESLNVFNVL
ncbi:hypothetical protein ANN_12923 [Periplaneta americana]|uniref:Uncharacterized protein n=1 Tax=Periplaneta americana TaxID=6978 RepID=A0ABQ8THX9_PERAM|nr:hypothetical protein ANN_12923 [Periplaneta americana]